MTTPPCLDPPTRRAVLGVAAALAATPALAVPPPGGRLRFSVFRNDARVGDHQLSFVRDGSVLKVTTDVTMSLRLGPVPVFRYAHHAVETWRDGRFERLETSTATNGRRELVRAARDGAGLRIETAHGVATAPAGAAPLTHWNSAALSGPLFNPQTGKLLKVGVSRHAGERLPGSAEPATRWALRGDAEIDDWYDADGVWAALRGRLPDRSTMAYRRA
jgi:hypothetical protein